MKVFTKLPEKLYFNCPVVTIGTYDGVHIGHRKIFRKLIEKAGSRGGESIVLTFSSHPRKLINPDAETKLITTTEEKLKAIEDFGIKYTILLDFSREIADLDARQFFHRFLVEKIGAKEIVIGYDHAFGKNREGNVDLLMELSRSTGIGVTRVDAEIYDSEPVSSTWLRREILGGNIETANSLLGRMYSFTGKVIQGEGRGRRIGFPTANIISYDPEKIIPGDGVYAVVLNLGNGERKKGMVNIGFNPTFSQGKRSIEVNIFDFDHDIYGTDISVEFYCRVRSEMKFQSPEELTKQLKEDKIRIMRILEKI
jgi:riboflavin kinase/FMN adenylyltransferase